MATPGAPNPVRLPINPAIRPGLAGETQLTVADEHLAPADLGSEVAARSVLTDVSGNKLRFEVVVKLEDLLLGTAEHKMAVVPRTP